MSGTFWLAWNCGGGGGVEPAWFPTPGIGTARCCPNAAAGPAPGPPAGRAADWGGLGACRGAGADLEAGYISLKHDMSQLSIAMDHVSHALGR